MYETWWKLTATPFQNALDARWYYESPAHEEALARLMFVIERQRRCGVVSGTAGCGKSTTLAMLALQLQRTQRELAVIDATSLTGNDLLWQAAVALDRNPSADQRPRELWQSISDHLHGLRFAGIQTVVLVDHFERAGRGFEDSVSRLIELDAAPVPWLTVIVAVRPSLGSGLPGRLAEFCDLRIELRPLDQPETAEYVRSALRRAGSNREIFTADALARVHERTEGVPRAINRVCELALLAAMGENAESIGPRIIDAVTDELEWPQAADRHAGCRNSMQSRAVSARSGATRPGSVY